MTFVLTASFLPSAKIPTEFSRKLLVAPVPRAGPLPPIVQALSLSVLLGHCAPRETFSVTCKLTGTWSFMKADRCVRVTALPLRWRTP